MSTDITRGRGTSPLRPSFTPDQVRHATFERAPFGRRGFDEHEVQGYLAGLAEELAARDGEIGRLAGENQQLKHALREWHRQLVGYDAAELIAYTQQQIEAQITQAEHFSREREQEATQMFDKIVADAHEAARHEAERLARAERGAASDVDSRGEPAWLVRQSAYAHALLQALDALAAQVHATRQAFTFEIGKLGDIADPDVPAPPAPAPGSTSGRIELAGAPPTPTATATTARGAVLDHQADVPEATDVAPPPEGSGSASPAGSESEHES